MSTMMVFPRTQSLQAASIYNQTTAQQESIIDISGLVQIILPATVIGMMTKIVSNTLVKKKQVKATTTESTASQSKKAATSG